MTELVPMNNPKRNSNQHNENNRLQTTDKTLQKGCS